MLTYSLVGWQEGTRRVEIMQVYGVEKAWEVIRQSIEDSRASYGGC
jgi:hypothetical protein